MSRRGHAPVDSQVATVAGQDVAVFNDNGVAVAGKREEMGGWMVRVRTAEVGYVSLGEQSVAIPRGQREVDLLVRPLYGGLRCHVRAAGASDVHRPERDLRVASFNGPG